MEIPGDMADAVEEGREMLMDTAANADDALTEKYLEDLELSEADIIIGLKKGSAEGTVFPVLFTDAVSEVGVTQLIHHVVDLLPSPASLIGKELKGVKPGTDEETTFTPGQDSPVVAYAFKRQYEAQGGDVTWLRVFSGSVKAGENFKHSDGRSSERMGQLNVATGRTKDKVDVAAPGDIVLAAKLKNTQIGDTLTSGVDFAFAPIAYPVPTSADAISPVTSGDEDKMAAGPEQAARGGSHLPADPAGPSVPDPAGDPGRDPHQLPAREAEEADRRGGGAPASAHRLQGDHPRHGREAGTPQEAERRPRPVRRRPSAHRTVAAR